MFKRKDEVTTFVDFLENLIRRTIDHKEQSDSESATQLNRGREAFEEYLNDICGLTQPVQDPSEDYKCPECGAPMKERTNRQNGNKFYGCTQYPECRGTRDENGLSRAEREEKKYKQDVSHQDGFSFSRPKRNPATEVGPVHDWKNPFER